MSARKKYRYILFHPCMPDTKISKCRLFMNTDISACKDVVRITIPDDMELIKDESKMFETVNDDRPLKDFEYVVIVKKDGKWITRPDLNVIKKSNRPKYY